MDCCGIDSQVQYKLCGVNQITDLNTMMKSSDDPLFLWFDG